MKPLKPSMREKKRYLLIKGKNLKKEIPKAIRDFIGVFGMSDVSLNFIEFKKNFSIIQINRGMLNLVRASLCVWPERMEVLRVSGTLKNLKKDL